MFFEKILGLTKEQTQTFLFLIQLLIQEAFSPFILINDTTQKFVTEPFLGIQYGDWKRVVTIALFAKNKLSFVDGSLPKRPINDPHYKACERVNNLVLPFPHKVCNN